MGKRNKSKRFIQDGKNAVQQHALQIPYHMTYAEAEAAKMNHPRSSTEEI
ncbi:MAG: hypothetical protein IMW92_00910 [Bacillales bacterium]|nr:hypothetical protein [Bacillales bacterium]